MKHLMLLYLFMSATVYAQNVENCTSIETTNQYSLQFVPLYTTDLELVYTWLHTPWVQPWFVPEPLAWNTFLETYQEKLSSAIEWNFLVYTDNQPFGYIRYYDAHQEPDGAGAFEPEGSYGIELFIGELAYLGKGYGTAMLSQFIKKVIEDQKHLNKAVKRFIIDPHIDNVAALKTYTKIGFTQVRIIEDPYYGSLLIMELYP